MTNKKTQEANSISDVALFRHGSNQQVRAGGSIVPAASSFLPYQLPHRPAELHSWEAGIRTGLRSTLPTAKSSRSRPYRYFRGPPFLIGSLALYVVADEPWLRDTEDIAGQAQMGVRRSTIRRLGPDPLAGRRKLVVEMAGDRNYVAAGKDTAGTVGRVWLVLVSEKVESLQKPGLDMRHVASAGGAACRVRTPLHRLAPELAGGMVAAAAVVGD